MEFSKPQKKFLREFISQKPYDGDPSLWTINCDSNLIIRKLVNAEVLEWDLKEKSLTIYSYEENDPNEVFEWIFFFNFLKDERYLYLLDLPVSEHKSNVRIYDRSKWMHIDDLQEDGPSSLLLPPGFNYFSKKILSNSKIAYSPIGTSPHTIYTEQVRTLNKFMKNTIHPTHKLRELVNNDFKTPEQKQSDLQNGFSRRTLRLTMITLAISTFFLVVSTILGVLGYCKDDNTKTDPEQHIELIKAIQNTSVDTTQIKIVSPIPLETNAKKQPNRHNKTRLRYQRKINRSEKSTNCN